MTRNTLNTLVRLTGVAIFVFIALRVDWSQVFVVIRNSDLRWLALSVLLLLPLITSKVFRWLVILKAQGVRYHFGPAFRASLSASYLGLVTPGRVGDLVRAAYVSQDTQVSAGLALASVIIDRLFDLALSATFSLIGLLIFGIGGNLALSIGFATALLVVGVTIGLNRKLLAIGLRWALRLLPTRWGQRVKQQGNRHGFDQFFAGVEALAGPRLLSPMLLSLASYAVLFTHAYLLARALGIPISLFQVAFAVSVTNLVAVLPISIAGVGTRDGAFIFLFSLFGLTSEQALAFSLMFLFAFVGFVGLGGAWIWFRDPLDLAAILVRSNSQGIHVTE